ncbi:hypothetical protein [Paenibacillus sp. UMB4589-SE434]|uniref:hypothetical protein n=1 Tax=Paenibacillus sp. UMB4589-SE434 TaxID=3046314 RepID=UPI00254BC9FA|nr:hypothetical protein [Paenibacillus sp. UMB4589-SE434]MDK8181705.1 hypothetical protein [Paenibacillus sp. UMB4589-SE434]
MDYTMKKGIVKFIVLPVAILCVALFVIIPMASAAFNAVFGSSVISNYKATVVELTNNKAILEWNEDRFVLDKNIYTIKRKVIGLDNFKYVKVGDTFDISVTAPGLLQKL